MASRRNQDYLPVKDLEVIETQKGSINKDHDEWQPTNSVGDFFKGLKLLILEHSFLYLMLLIVPFGFISNFIWGDVPTFILCMLAIIPLSKMLGQATEELSLRTGQTIGGLLNATFGNAVELIISIIALRENLLRVVQASLLGSILSNLLLVLGMSFFFGGMKYKEQHFNGTAAQTSASMLILVLVAVLMPAVFFLSTNTGDVTHQVLNLSRITAIVMLIFYFSYLFFQLKTHKHLYDEAPNPEGSEEDEETPRLSVWGAILLLSIVTVLVSFLAEYLVGSIEHVVKSLHISETFIGIILLPIVGNAAEHVTAVSVAMKNKMDLSIGVALGSSLQIALLVIPTLVILGWIIGRELSLYFQMFETVTLFVTVIIVNAVISDGESNWLEGIFLLGTYFIIGAGFYLHE